MALAKPHVRRFPSTWTWLPDVDVSWTRAKTDAETVESEIRLSGKLLAQAHHDLWFSRFISHSNVPIPCFEWFIWQKFIRTRQGPRSPWVCGVSILTLNWSTLILWRKQDFSLRCIFWHSSNLFSNPSPWGVDRHALTRNYHLPLHDMPLLAS